LESDSADEFILESSAFKYGQEIPDEFTAHGGNRVPPLSWSHMPPDTEELVLIMQDPDAPKDPPYVHWILYKIPKDDNPIDPARAKIGKNSHGEISYFGPEPPPNTGFHRYYFLLLALDREFDLKEGLSRDEILDIIRSNILGEAELMGKYQYHETQTASGH